MSEFPNKKIRLLLFFGNQVLSTVFILVRKMHSIALLLKKSLVHKMRVLATYRKLINHPTVVIAVGVMGISALLLNSTYFENHKWLSFLNISEATLIGLVIVSYVFMRYKEQTALGFYALIFWLDLLISPFLFLHSTEFTGLFLRNSMFYWALLPLVGLLLGNRSFLVITLLFFLQLSVVTLISNNTFLWNSYFSITVILVIYLVIIYSFINSLEHYVRTQAEIQATLEKQSNELNESNSAKSKLLSIIGHDLRSPLMSLNNLSVLINEEVSQIEHENLTDYAEILSLTVNQTSLLVNNLLEWSRSHDNRITLEQKIIELEPFAKSLEDLVHFQLHTKNIEFTLGPFESPIILADQNTLLTILRNLLTNAIKFTPQNGHIRLFSQFHKGGFQLILKDNGLGMDPQTVEHLLDPSVFNTTTGTDMEKGSGIGFNLVLEMMRLHGGQVSIDSAPGEGTEIQLFFPEKIDFVD